MQALFFKEKLNRVYIKNTKALTEEELLQAEEILVSKKKHEYSSSSEEEQMEEKDVFVEHFNYFV